MGMRKIIFICVSLVMLAGCAVTPPIKTSNDVYMRSSVDVDPYKKTTWIRSPMIYNWERMGYYHAFLRALVNDKSVSFYQFYVSDSAKDWRFYDRAYDASGNDLDFVEIDHQVTDSAWTKEVFAINLSRQYFDDAKNTGLNIKAVGKRGDKIITLPGFYVEGFLQKVDEYKGKH